MFDPPMLLWSLISNSKKISLFFSWLLKVFLSYTVCLTRQDSCAWIVFLRKSCFFYNVL